MKLKKYCFAFNSYYQALEILKICKEIKIKPILFIKYQLINGLGTDWIEGLKDQLYKEFNTKDFYICVDVKANYGLFIALVEKKIDYIKVEADKKMLRKLNQIAKINKVLINQNFSVVDLSNLKLQKTISKKIYNKL